MARRNKKNLNLSDILNNYQPIPTREKLATAIKNADKKHLFPNIFGLERQKRQILEVLMSGKGVLLSGTYGVAKTEISKQILELLNSYHRNNEVYIPKNCPVQEDALNIAYSLGLVKEIKGVRPACPSCYEAYVAEKRKPKEIPIERLEALVEGKGFARIQGSSDVLPEEVVGTYNLTRLAEIGDPFDPRVFQVGKIGQASSGLLFVDELGKLGEAGQYALIQASQEGIVTPSKSRDTYPIDLLLVATTNPVDEEEICGAIQDRLVNIKIPIVDEEQEIKIVKKELEKVGNPPYCPSAFIGFGVKAVRNLRGLENLELSPRASINSALIARSSAVYDKRDVASFCDFKEGVYTAITGKARFEDKDDVEAKLNRKFPHVKEHLRDYFPKVDFPEIIHELRGETSEDISIGKVEKALKAKRDYTATKQFAEIVRKEESIGDEQLPKVIGMYLIAYDRGCQNGI